MVFQKLSSRKIAFVFILNMLLPGRGEVIVLQLQWVGYLECFLSMGGNVLELYDEALDEICQLITHSFSNALSHQIVYTDDILTET